MSAYIGTGSNLTQKVWRPGVIHQAEYQTMTMGFLSTEDDSLFVLYEDLTKKRGDTIQTLYSPTEDQEGFLDQDTIEGNEKETNQHPMTFKIDYLAMAWRTRGVMSQQRVSFDQKKTIFIKATKLWARRWDQWVFNQLAGYTPITYINRDGTTNVTGDAYHRTGMNPIPTLDAGHLVYPTGETTDQGLDSTGDDFNLRLLEKLIRLAMDGDSGIDPIPPDGEGFYHFFMHPKQWEILRANTTTGEWQDLTRAQMEGGKPYEKTGHYGTWLGIKDNTKLHVSTHVPPGVDSTAPQTSVPAVKRGIFCGANCLSWGFGEGYADGDHLDWSEERLDHRKWSIAVDTVSGCAANNFNGKRYNHLVVPTYVG